MKNSIFGAFVPQSYKKVAVKKPVRFAGMTQSEARKKALAVARYCASRFLPATYCPKYPH